MHEDLATGLAFEFRAEGVMKKHRGQRLPQGSNTLPEKEARKDFLREDGEQGPF